MGVVGILRHFRHLLTHGRNRRREHMSNKEHLLKLYCSHGLLDSSPLRDAVELMHAGRLREAETMLRSMDVSQLNEREALRHSIYLAVSVFEPARDSEFMRIVEGIDSSPWHELDPQDQLLYLVYRGIAAEYKADNDVAIDKLTKAEQIVSQLGEVDVEVRYILYLARARANYGMQSYEKALSDYQSLRKLSEEFPDDEWDQETENVLLSEMGLTQHLLGDSKAAKNNLHRVQVDAYESDFLRSNHFLALQRLYYDSEEYSESLKCYTEISLDQLQPGERDTVVCLAGLCHYAFSNMSEAKVLLERVMESEEPADWPQKLAEEYLVRIQRWRALFTVGYRIHREKQPSDKEHLLKLFHSHGLLDSSPLRETVELMHAGKFSEAETILRSTDVSKLNESEALRHSIYLAVVVFDPVQDSEFTRIIEGVDGLLWRKLDPQDQLLYLVYRGVAAESKTDHKVAVDILTKAEQIASLINEVDLELRYLLYLTRARASFKEESYKDALSDYQKLMELSKEFPDGAWSRESENILLSEMGLTQHALGDSMTAKEILHRVEVDAYQSKYLRTRHFLLLQKLHYDMADYSESLKYYAEITLDHVLAYQKDEAVCLAGLCHYALANMGEAKLLLERVMESKEPECWPHKLAEQYLKRIQKRGAGR